MEIIQESKPLEEEEFRIKFLSPSGELEGPLSVLWQFIESYQVDIFQVSLAKITDDFLKFIQDAKRFKIDLASDFVLMASRLIYYKSKALLPDPGFEDENQDVLPPEIVQQLLEYRKYQQAAKHLEDILEVSEGVFSRENQDYRLSNYEETYNINELIQSFLLFLKRKEKSKQLEEEKFFTIDIEKITVEEKINLTRKILLSTHEFEFHELFENPFQVPIIEVIVSFIAILELTKLKEIILVQKEIFGNIRIIKKSVTVR